MKRSVSLPPATTGELTLSSVIVADHVGTRAAPYTPAEQAAHPYAIGLTDITLARDKLKWQPKVALDEGLKKTIAYFDSVLRGNEDMGQVGR